MPFKKGIERSAVAGMKQGQEAIIEYRVWVGVVEIHASDVLQQNKCV